MPEGKLHRRARTVLRPGDVVGQPSGDPFCIASIRQVASYSSDEDTRLLQADLVVESTDGQTVHIEFLVTHPVNQEKLERLREAGVYRVLQIKLLPHCGDFTDEQLREYIADGNSVLKGPYRPHTHEWIEMAPSYWERELTPGGAFDIERIDEDLTKHSCFVEGCKKPIVTAVEGLISEDLITRQAEMLPDSTRLVPTLPTYACEDHEIEASLRQLPEGAEEGWHKPVEEYFARQPQDSKNNCKRIPCRIDPAIDMLRRPHYDASTTIGLPVALGDCQ